jgi:hypothetical protein
VLFTHASFSFHSCRINLRTFAPRFEKRRMFHNTFDVVHVEHGSPFREQVATFALQIKHSFLCFFQGKLVRLLFKLQVCNDGLCGGFFFFHRLISGSLIYFHHPKYLDRAFLQNTFELIARSLEPKYPSCNPFKTTGFLQPLYNCSFVNLTPKLN